MDYKIGDKVIIKQFSIGGEMKKVEKIVIAELIDIRESHTYPFLVQVDTENYERAKHTVMSGQFTHGYKTILKENEIELYRPTNREKIKGELLGGMI